MKRIFNLLLKALPWLMLLALLCFGIYTRFYGLSLWGLTYDECLTEERSHWTLGELWRFYITNRAPFNALCYYVDGHIWSLINGRELLREWQIRLPSALFSFLAIPLFFLLGRRLKDSLCGLMCAAFGAASLLLMLHGREARYYSYVCFFTTLAFYEAAAILSRPAGDRESLKHYALYALYSIGGLGSHQGFYIYFAFSNVFLGLYALLALAPWGAREKDSAGGPDWRKKIALFWDQACMLVLPCLAYCYQFIRATGLDKPYTPTGDGAAHLLPELTPGIMAQVMKKLWEGFPLAPLILWICLGAALLLLFTKLRKVALYALFIKFSTFLFLRLATQRLTYEQFREKYVIFLLLIDFFILAPALVYLLEWLGKLPASVFWKRPGLVEGLARLACTLAVVLLAFRICGAGFKEASKKGLFIEELEGVRYVFNYLEKNYKKGDIVIYQAEPNSWIHKNVLYEQKLRENTHDWIVAESIQLPYMADKISKEGSTVWYILMYRPGALFLPYFYDGMRAFGARPEDRHAMVGLCTAQPVRTLADALYLTAYLIRCSSLHNHPQYESHLIREGLAKCDLSDAVFAEYADLSVRNGQTALASVYSILKDPRQEFYAYRILNEWWQGLCKAPQDPRPRTMSVLEDCVYSYLEACRRQDAAKEKEGRDKLVAQPHGYWLYDRIYHFTADFWPRPYYAPAELEKILTRDEIWQLRSRLGAMYNKHNKPMVKDWNRLVNGISKQRKGK